MKASERKVSQKTAQIEFERRLALLAQSISPSLIDEIIQLGRQSGNSKTVLRVFSESMFNSQTTYTDVMEGFRIVDSNPDGFEDDKARVGAVDGKLFVYFGPFWATVAVAIRDWRASHDRIWPDKSTTASPTI